MSEEIKAAEGKEESFEELLNQSFKTLNNGDRVTGIVTAITPTEVQVDVGAKQAAYIKLSVERLRRTVNYEENSKLYDDRNIAVVVFVTGCGSQNPNREENVHVLYQYSGDEG